mmetsp:Transcript_2912/g.6720  ORF Transcript_2912/g.6720 Transcript_2912/m.6720 type:complete len:388 (-) Transcript_2912:74-1237(-)
MATSHSRRAELLASVRKGVKTFLAIFLYVMAGCFFYTNMEEKDCESEHLVTAPGYDVDRCKEPWTVIDSIYFAMVTMSTVGFGDFSPGSLGSKVFTCFYILLGITVVFVEVSERLVGTIDYVEGIVMGCICRCRGKNSNKVLDIDCDGEPDFVLPAGAVVYWTSNLAFPLTVIILFQFFSSLVYSLCQPGLGYWDALYHCLVTATTVGYGDVNLSTQASRLWAIFHIAMSVSWLAALLAEVPERRATRALELQRVAILHRQLNIELIKALDKDGTGVDKLEFVVGMLIELKAELCGSPLAWEDVLPFIKQFEAADMDHSGILSKEDLALMVARKREQLGEKHARRIDKHVTSMSLGSFSSSLARSQTVPSPKFIETVFSPGGATHRS